MWLRELEAVIAIAVPSLGLLRLLHHLLLVGLLAPVPKNISQLQMEAGWLEKWAEAEAIIILLRLLFVAAESEAKKGHHLATTGYPT